MPTLVDGLQSKPSFFDSTHHCVQLESLRKQQRLHEVTLMSLRNAGFVKFAWVNPGERPGPTPLFSDESDGAFVYEMDGGILEGVSSGKSIVDCATLAVEDMTRLEAQVKAKGEIAEALAVVQAEFGIFKEQANMPKQIEEQIERLCQQRALACLKERYARAYPPSVERNTHACMKNERVVSSPESCPRVWRSRLPRMILCFLGGPLLVRSLFRS